MQQAGLSNGGKAKTIHSSRAILNMSTGPVEVDDRVMQAQIATLLTPHVAQFWKVHDSMCEQLQSVLCTSGQVLVTHGSIRTGLDLALGNVIAAGTRVLCIENGYWGSLIGDYAERHGANVTRLSFKGLDPVDPAAIAGELLGQTFDLVTLVHVETNTGIVNPVAAVGELLRDSPALFFVDTACSAGAIPVLTDAWGIDIGVAGSHKCLASIPGLAVMTLSARAMTRIDQLQRMGSMFNVGEIIANTQKRRVTPPITQPTTLVHALHCSLSQLLDAGLEQWWSRHVTVARYLRGRLRALGLSLLLEVASGKEDADTHSVSVIAVNYPEGIADVAFRQMLLDEHGIFVIGNVGDQAGKSFRIGLMSPPQMRPENIERLVLAIESTLHALRRANAGEPA